MLNQITLLGKIAKDLEVRESSNGRSFSIVTLEVDKEDPETGELKKEEIGVSLWGNTAENTAKYAGKDSVITIKGRAANRVLDFSGGQALRTIGIVGERVSFIQTRAPGSVKTDTSESETKLPFSLNQATLVGRTVRDVELQRNSSGRAYANVTLAIQRAFKNQETNEYDSDFIEMTLWDSQAEEVVKSAGKGSVLSVHGHMISKTLEFTNQMAVGTIGIVGDKVSFPQTKEPQRAQQISNSQQEIGATDEWIPMSEMEGNSENGDIIDILNQNKKTESSLEL